MKRAHRTPIPARFRARIAIIAVLGALLAAPLVHAVAAPGPPDSDDPRTKRRSLVQPPVDSGTSYRIQAWWSPAGAASVDLPRDDPAFRLDVFPNPNDGRFRLDIAGTFEDTVELTIINAAGLKVYSRQLATPGELYISLQSMRKGIYFAQIRAGNKVFSHPIIYAYDE